MIELETKSCDFNRQKGKTSLFVGWGVGDITPKTGIPLGGRPWGRVSKGVSDPLKVTALAIGNRKDKPLLWLSIDAYAIDRGIVSALAAGLAGRFSGFEREYLICSCTHSHTSPFLSLGGLEAAGSGVPAPNLITGAVSDEYINGIFIPQAVEACVQAAGNLRPAFISPVLGHAASGHCFRVRHRDGTVGSFDNTDDYNFDCLEGPADTSVHIIYTYSGMAELTGAVISFPCPSEVMRNKETISSDIVGSLRGRIAARLGKNLPVLALCACAGDKSPNCMVRRGRGVPDMYGIEGAEEIGGRLADAFEYNLEWAGNNILECAEFGHFFMELELPVRQGSGIAHAPVHVIRLGEAVLATNPFELYSVYGMRMRARINAAYVITVQLSDGYMGYLPTRRAAESGGYSTGPEESAILPEGGELLTERSIEEANRLMQERDCDSFHKRGYDKEASDG